MQINANATITVNSGVTMTSATSMGGTIVNNGVMKSLGSLNNVVNNAKAAYNNSSDQNDNNRNKKIINKTDKIDVYDIDLTDDIQLKTQSKDIYETNHSNPDEDLDIELEAHSEQVLDFKNSINFNSGQLTINKELNKLTSNDIYNSNA